MRDVLASFLAIIMPCLSQAAEVDFSKLNYGDYESWHQCSVKPQPGVVLSARERCEIEKLSARCNAADDCLVTCMSSPDGRNAGGGCWHICFETLHDLRSWNKPNDWERCAMQHEGRAIGKGDRR